MHLNRIGDELDVRARCGRRRESDAADDGEQ
jgi:hypothetical protein